MYSKLFFIAIALTSKIYSMPCNTPDPNVPQPDPNVPGTPAVCNWFGHCLGDTCAVDDDCDNDWMCTNGVCAVDTDGGNGGNQTTPDPNVPQPDPNVPGVACNWLGHCLGDTCAVDDDCDNEWVCTGGVCAVDTDGGNGGNQTTPDPNVPQPDPNVPGTPAVCNWLGHCLGDTCAVDDDCDNDWVCTGGVCAIDTDGGNGGCTDVPTPDPNVPQPTPDPNVPGTPAACNWLGHCLGDTCAVEEDCDNDWVCTGGVCAVLN
jgi:hypothetical protein